MEDRPDTSLDALWREHASVFGDFDDLTLARWLAQTLSQLQGRVWRLSHPLIGVYRLASQAAHDRHVWLKRLAAKPEAYDDSPCCRAPFLPLFTRDIGSEGLLCQHCGEVLVPAGELPEDLRNTVIAWAKQYDTIHAVAHWDEARQKRVADYQREFENAARRAERMLAQAGREILPRFLDHYPAIIWEDHDECLEVEPEDTVIDS